MSLLKVGVGFLILIVLGVFGLNQYESYKLNSKANNAIEHFTDDIKKKESELNEKKAIAKCKMTISSIKSAIMNDRQEKILRNHTFSYIETLSSNNDNLFDKILAYPLTSSTEFGKWSKIGKNKYAFHLKDDIIFKYDNENGNFQCISNCSLLY